MRSLSLAEIAELCGPGFNPLPILLRPVQILSNDWGPPHRFDGYAAFRSQPDSQAAVSAALISLTASIVNLENAFAAGLQADPQAIAKIRQRASIIRGRASERLSVSDILTELQIAAAVAATVRGEATYSDVAAIVVETTSQALAAEKATAGQPIDLTTIQPVLPIQ